MAADDRRDGSDRREETDITLGEVYRICQRIDDQVSEMKEGTEKDVHHLRSKIDANNVSIEVLKHKVFDLESKGRDWRGWISSGVIGATLAMMPFIFQWLMTKP